jgi:hypothetical protein
VRWGHEYQGRTAGTCEPCRTAGARQPGQESRDRTAGTGTARTGQLEKSVRTGNRVQGGQNMAVRTGQDTPGWTTLAGGLVGLYIWDKTIMTGQPGLNR